MSPRAVVVHDVLGTLFSLDAPIEELKSIFSAQLASAPHIFAELVVMDWYHAAQRDFGFISMHGAYKPIGQVFAATLPRVLLQAGLAPEGSGSSDLASAKRGAGRAPATAVEAPGFEEVVARMMGSLKRLTPRPHMQDAFATYEAAGIEAWGASNGSRELSTAIFEGALGKGCVRDHGVQGDAALKGVGVFSCDEVEIAKPDPRVYDAVLQRIERGEKDVQKFFVATHSWDTFAAQKAGFKVVWVTNEEFHGAQGIYGTPDYIATDLADAAKQIAAAVRG